jgi:hypothetical protein
VNGVDSEPWTAGADLVEHRLRAGRRVAVPSGRLHAVSGQGLVDGRALCRAPVTLLDPADWTWPDDGDAERPLCWTCLALTC